MSNTDNSIGEFLVGKSFHQEAFNITEYCESKDTIYVTTKTSAFNMGVVDFIQEVKESKDPLMKILADKFPEYFI